MRELERVDRKSLLPSTRGTGRVAVSFRKHHRLFLAHCKNTFEQFKDYVIYATSRIAMSIIIIIEFLYSAYSCR